MQAKLERLKVIFEPFGFGFYDVNFIVYDIEPAMVKISQIFATFSSLHGGVAH
jgi:hypothetical protein